MHDMLYELPPDLAHEVLIFGFHPKALSKDAIYEVGKTYWCGYWSKWYKVLDASYKHNGKWLDYVVVQWQDELQSTLRP